MAQHADIELPASDTRSFGARAWPLFRNGLLIGAVALIVALLTAWLTEDFRRFGFAYVVSFAYVLSLSLGCMALVVLMHLFRAGWGVVIRRPAEIFAANMPVLAILSAPILVFVILNNGLLYSWAQPLEGGAAHALGGTMHIVLTDADAAPAPIDVDHAGDDHAGGHELVGLTPEKAHYVQLKRVWLNIPFFVARWVVYFGILSGIGLWYWRQSTLQDTTGDASLTRRMEIFSAPATLLFAFTLTAVAFDLLMSLDPLWYSTIFGVYYFAGSFMGGLAMLILVLMGLQRWGHLQSVTAEHFHDLGKLMFAFVFFWGYIAFSQYMLLWYASLPETAYWFELHGFTTATGKQTGWSYVGLVLLFGHLLIPFVALLPRWVKRSRKLLAFWAIWLLVVHWIDLWWVVMPLYDSTQISLGVIEIAVLVGVLAIFLAGGARLAAGTSLVPTKDPRLSESLGHVNL
ncbi:MAG: hypothetical protein WD009_12400 [Phycisphaeraceae bacterium]